MLDAEKAAQGVIEAVKGFVSRSFERLSERIAGVEGRVDSVSKSIQTPDELRRVAKEAAEEAVKQIPIPQDGKNADPVDIADIVAQVGAQIQRPTDGKDADPEFIRAEIAKAVAEIPAPKNGKDADPIDTVAIAAEIASKIPVPKNGEDAQVDYQLVNREINEAVAKAVAEIPKPKDTPIEVVSALIAGEVSKAMSLLPKPTAPKDGEPGRDALQIEVLPAIDSSKGYPRGTFASHKGGLWRAARNTDVGDDLQMCGWHSIVEGFPEIEIDQCNDIRTITIRAVSSTGRKVEKHFSLPVMIDRGVFKSGAEYVPGDTVSYGGSIWIAQTATKEVPGTGDADGWRLAVKRGQNGKDYEPQAKTPPQIVRLK